MAGLAKSSRESKVTVIRVEDKKEFVREFNKSKPSEEFFKSCEKAGDLFGIRRQG